MFGISKDVHIGIYHDNDNPLFLDNTSAVFNSRKACMKYLLKFMSKDEAVDIITALMKNPDTWYSF